jgi:hypothetical protein
MSVWHDTGGDLAPELLAVIEQLARALPATVDPSADAELVASHAVIEAIDAYVRLHDGWVLPSPGRVFGVGYPLPGGQGTDLRQLADGVRSGAPITARLLGTALNDDVAAFARSDSPRRASLAERFAAHLGSRGPLGDLARYEAALVPTGVDDTAVALGPVGADSRVVVARGVRVLSLGVDAVDLAESAEQGRVTLALDGALAVDGVTVAARPSCLVIARDPAGDLLVLDVLPSTGRWLELAEPWDPAELDEGERVALQELGVLVPARWPERDPVPPQ